MRHKNKEGKRCKEKVESRKLKVLGVATLLILTFSISTLQAQTSVNATGGNTTGSGGSASYSVGQVVYTTNQGTGGNTVAQGVQQPFEILVVTEIEEAEDINLLVTAYPNPTTDYFTLNIEEFDVSNLSYQLYDINGKLLQQEKITGNKTNIIMSNLVPANYFVKVIQGNKEVKTFKIIKN